MHPDLIPLLRCPNCRRDLSPAAACAACGPVAFQPAPASPSAALPSVADRWLRSLHADAAIAVVGSLPDRGLRAVAVNPADALPLKDGAFDAVIFVESLAASPRPDALLREAARALKAGGRWLSIDANDGRIAERGLQASGVAAGLSVAVGFSGFPLKLDPLLSRAACVASQGRVIFASGFKGDPPPAARPSWTTLAAAAAAMLAVTIVAGAWTPDPAVANRSPSYYHFGDDAILRLANAPASYGTVMVTDVGRKLEKYRDMEDLGYILSLQFFSLSGVRLTPYRIATIHNAVFTASTVCFGLAVLWVLNSTLAGWLAFGLTLALGLRMSAVIYAMVDNHSAMALFPLPVIAALLMTMDAVRRDRRKAAVAWIAALGALVAGVDLIRHSSGMAAGGGAAIAIALMGIPWRRKAAWLALLAATYLFALHVPLGILRIHRDVTLGMYRGFKLSYFKRAPYHTSTYSLLAGVARYPNSLGLKPTDQSLDEYIIRAAKLKPPIHTNDLLDAAPALFWRYVRQYPFEYAGIVARGFSELPLFLAYVTFLKERKFDWGLPAAEPGVTLDEGDKVPGVDLIMNFRLRYLNLSPLETTAFLTAVAALLAAAAAEIRRRVRRGASAGVLMGPWIYLSIVALPRALLAGAGQDFLFAFWAIVALSAALLLAYRPRVV